MSHRFRNISTNTARALNIKTFILEANQAHADAKKAVIEHINNNQTSCNTFAREAYKTLMRAESLVRALNLTPDYVHSNSFDVTLTDEAQADELIKHLTEYRDDLARQEARLVSKGLNEESVWELSGLTTYRSHLDLILPK